MLTGELQACRSSRLAATHRSLKLKVSANQTATLRTLLAKVLPGTEWEGMGFRVKSRHDSNYI